MRYTFLTNRNIRSVSLQLFEWLPLSLFLFILYSFLNLNANYIVFIDIWNGVIMDGRNQFKKHHQLFKKPGIVAKCYLCTQLEPKYTSFSPLIWISLRDLHIDIAKSCSSLSIIKKWCGYNSILSFYNCFVTKARLLLWFAIRFFKTNATMIVRSNFQLRYIPCLFLLSCSQQGILYNILPGIPI